MGRHSPPELNDPATATKRRSQRTQLSLGSIFPCPMPRNQEGWVVGFYRVTDTWNIRVEQEISEKLKKGTKKTPAKKSKSTAKDADADDNAEAEEVQADDAESDAEVEAEASTSNKSKARGKPKAGAQKSKKIPKPKPSATPAITEKVITMARLERWDIENKAWYAKDDIFHDPPPLEFRQYDIEVDEEECQTCRKKSMRLFKESFLCLNDSCSDHWRIGGSICTTKLTYKANFLQKRLWRKFEGSQGPQNTDDEDLPPTTSVFTEWVRENYENLDPADMTAGNFGDKMGALNEGFVCPECGMLNRRLKWHKWQCVNGACPFEYIAPPPYFSPQDLERLAKGQSAVDWEKLFTAAPANDPPPPAPKQARRYQSRPINNLFVKKYDNGGYTAYDYDLEYGCGVTVLVPQKDTNAGPNGADGLWKSVFDLAADGRIPLEKNFTSAAASAAGTVTNHFIANFGAVYNLSVDMKSTIPWKDTPQPLKDARDVIERLTRQYQLKRADGSLEDGEGDMNECYVAAYFTRNAMNWHDDGERGLGSVVATWTLGGTGRMQIANKLPHFYGKYKMTDQVADKAFLSKDYALPGCWLERKRKALKTTLDEELERYPNEKDAVHKAKRQEAQDAWFTAYKALLNEYKVDVTVGAGLHPLLDIPLPHGSIAVMRGAKTQELYDHRVFVDSPLRIALTFRYISDEHYKDAKGNRIKPGKSLGDDFHVPDEEYLTQYPQKTWELKRNQQSSKKQVSPKKASTEQEQSDDAMEIDSGVKPKRTSGRGKRKRADDDDDGR